MDLQECILHILDVDDDLNPITNSKWNTIKRSAGQWMDCGLDNAEKKFSFTLEKKENFGDFDHHDHVHNACYTV